MFCQGFFYARRPTRSKRAPVPLDMSHLVARFPGVKHEPFRGWPADQRVNPAVPVVPMETGRDVDFFVHIGCTDQHRHKPMVLAAAIRELDGELHMSRALEWYAPPAGPDAEPGFNRSAYRFHCPRCPRNPQINRDDWWNLVFRLVLAGRNKLDISRLP